MLPSKRVNCHVGTSQSIPNLVTASRATSALLFRTDIRRIVFWSTLRSGVSVGACWLVGMIHDVNRRIDNVFYVLLRNTCATRRLVHDSAVRAFYVGQSHAMATLVCSRV